MWAMGSCKDKETELFCNLFRVHDEALDWMNEWTNAWMNEWKIKFYLISSSTLLSRASVAVPQGSSAIWPQTAYSYRVDRTEFIACCIRWRCFLAFKMKLLILNSTFENTGVLLSCHCWAKFIWTRHGSNTVMSLWGEMAWISYVFLLSL